MQTDQKPDATAQQKPILPPVRTNASLQTLFVDNVVVNTRKDGMNFIRFVVALPDGLYEQVRIMTNAKDIQRIIDSLCRSSKYYPLKPTETEVSVKKQ
jgi:hypothetical protein